MRSITTLAKALSDQQRVQALVALQTGELCVCQIIELLGLAPSTVSKHMTILRQAGLLDSRKEGRWIYYRLSNSPSPEAAATLDWLRVCLRTDSLARDVARRSKAIRKASKEELCQCYHPSGDNK
jgi:ArsR family transcriptional regulator, arsenate/arsenite/antimonite-responsive transcriptional repressor